MDEKEFKNISVKGRVAYGIRCLEQTLIYYNCSLENWKWIIEKIWGYTSVVYLDDWFYEIAEFMPDSILDDKDCYPEDCEYLSEEQFYRLVRTYSEDSNPVINRIIRLIFEMGTSDLYSKLEGCAQNSLDCLNKIMCIMVQENIELPSSTPFSNYSYKENNGWGESFDGKKSSLILT